MMNEVTPSGIQQVYPGVPVLVVDDNPGNRLAFTAALSPLGLDLVLAESGAEALARVAERDFAVILLDVRMPVLNGYQTAELIRRQKSARYTPILFMSAYDMTPAQVTRAYVAGATDYVPSPVDADLLVFKVAAFVQLYLRDEAVLRSLRDLRSTYGALQADIAASNGISGGMQQKVSALETTIERLRTEIDRCTCGCSPAAAGTAEAHA